MSSALVMASAEAPGSHHLEGGGEAGGGGPEEQVGVLLGDELHVQAHRAEVPDVHGAGAVAALDADADEQARALAIAIYELGGELLAETMAAADCGSDIARRALRLRAELRRLDAMGLDGRRAN